jgi:MFS transporter, DHA2 family, multidrug resistance protein
MMLLLVQGVAMSILFVALLSIILDGVPPHQIPAASGLSNFLRIVAGSFATSITTTFWDKHAALHQTRLAETSSIYSPSLTESIHQLSAAGLNQQQSIAVLAHELGNQAPPMSALDFFWIAGWLCWGIAASILFTRRPRGTGGHAVAAD